MRASEESRPTKAERSGTKTQKETASNRSKPAAKLARVKIVWEVCGGTGTTVKTFPYPDKAAAEAKTRALTRSTGRVHMLRATKVPME